MLQCKSPSRQVPCQKQNCCGVSTDHYNYLSLTKRGGTVSKKRLKRNKKSETTKQILQEHWDHLKEENKNLEKKLHLKVKKIEELKLKIRVFEADIKQYQQKEENWNKQKYKGDDSRRKVDTQNKIQYNKIIEDSHLVAKQTLQRYKVLEDEYQTYKQTTQRKISILKKENYSLQTQHTQKTYNNHIQELKRQLTKFREEKISQNMFTQSQSQEIEDLKRIIGELRIQNHQLRDQNACMEEEIQSYRSNNNKEVQLRENLDIINKKVTNWEKQYRSLHQQCREWQERYNELWQRYERKKNKYKTNNEEWAQIFKEFLEEIDKLKTQLEAEKEKNMLRYAQ